MRAWDENSRNLGLKYENCTIIFNLTETKFEFLSGSFVWIWAKYKIPIIFGKEAKVVEDDHFDFDKDEDGTALQQILIRKEERRGSLDALLTSPGLLE